MMPTNTLPGSRLLVGGDQGLSCRPMLSRWLLVVPRWPVYSSFFVSSSGQGPSLGSVSVQHLYVTGAPEHLRVKQINPTRRWQPCPGTYLFAFLLFPVFAHQLAAFAGNDCQIRSGILDRDDWLRLKGRGKRGRGPKSAQTKLPFSDPVALPTGRAAGFIRAPTCLVKTILPSRNGGTKLCTRRCTLAALSSSKSSSTSSRWTTPLVSMRLVSQRSLS